MGELRMPSLGADMEAGTLVAWKVKPGDAVKRGEIVAEVETQKGIIEIEIWEDGVVDALTVAPGAKVPVGTVLATVRAGAAPAPAPAPPPPPAPPPAHVLASPAARQLARERGIDLAHLAGTGPHGAITRDDVERALPLAPHEPEKPAPAPAAGMRMAIAAAMSRSKREIPHYYLAHDVDATTALAWLETKNAARPPESRVLLAAVLLRAVALAIAETPQMNGFFTDGAFHPSAAVHLGVAIALRQGGLVAPAIHDANEKGVSAIMDDLRDLVARTRAGRLRGSELSDATITVTSLGDQGVDAVYGVIYPPQVALVGFGQPRERAWASGGMLGARMVLTSTLAADHRVSDGHAGARFLRAIARALEDPTRWEAS